MVHLITEHIDIWTAAQTQKTNGGRGRGKNSNGQNQHGIKKLREMILELAVRGKLAPQDPNDEPAFDQLKKLKVKQQKLIDSGKAKPTRKHQNLGEAEGYYEIPMNWKWEFLAYIPLWPLKDGDWVESKDQNPDGDVRLVQLADVGDRVYRDKSSRFMTSAKAEELNCTYIEKGDVLIARLPDPLGRACIFPGDEKPCVTVVDVAICRCDNSNIDNRYLIVPLNSQIVRNRIEEHATGTTRKRVSTGNLGQIQIPIPPLVEQQRIVAKVDELMALCDQLEQQQTDSNTTHQTLVKTMLATPTNAADQGEFAKALQRIANHFDTLFTTEQSIDNLKQTILQLAVMGKLAPQDPKDEPASVLLEKIAKEKARLVKEGKIKKQKPLPDISKDEKPFDLPAGWEFVRLQETIDVRDGTHDSPKDAIGQDTYPLVTSKNFDNGTIKFDEARRISAEDHFNISKRSFVERYDILFSMIGGNLGNQVMVIDDRPFSVKNVALFKYYDRELTSPFYIKKFMEHLALDLQSKAAGGAQPFVSLGFLRKLVIAIPPVEEQRRIVAKVDELMSLCDTLKARLNDAQTTQVQLADAIVEQAVA